MATRPEPSVPELPTAEAAAAEAALTNLRRWGPEAFVAEIVGLFLTEAPVRLAAARVAHGGGDVAALGLALHSLRSSSAQFGGLRLVRACELAEAALGRGELVAIPTRLDELEAALAAFAAWLAPVTRAVPARPAPAVAPPSA